VKIGSALSNNKWVWLIGSVLIAVAAIWFIESPRFYGDICKETKDSNYPDCSRYHLSLVVAWHVLEFFENYDGAVTAASTVVIAALTVLLWISTHKMWEEANAARQLALSEFGESHFPRLEVRRVRLRFDAKNQGILFVISNVGNATASNIVANLNHWLGAPEAVTHQLKRECMPPYGKGSVDISAAINRPDLAGRPELLPRTRTFHFYPVPELNADWMGRFIAKKATVVFYGYIDYSDPSGQRRGMGFFRTLREGRFWPEEDDPDYEWN
jgi:hypothetical protein